jgi:hypothetical protein
MSSSLKKTQKQQKYPFLAHKSGRGLLMLVRGPKRTLFLDSASKNGSGMAL